MKYQVVLSTVDDVIYEGSRSECEVIMKAFTQYNGARNIALREVEEATLSDDMRDEIQVNMVYIIMEVHYGSLRDIFNHGIKGYDEYTDEELLEEYESMESHDKDLLAEARAMLVIQEVLS